jgi:hypothetical protein
MECIRVQPESCCDTRFQLGRWPSARIGIAFGQRTEHKPSQVLEKNYAEI